MFRQTMTTVVFFSLAACGSDAEQSISGRVTQGSFPEPVTQVHAIGAHQVIVADVLADDSFLLSLPAGDRYRIEMVSATRDPDLVFPRASGVDMSIFIAATSVLFDLGNVRYIAADEGGVAADSAVPDHSPEDGDDGEGGDQDSGEGGDQDTGGGGQDTGTGGGQDTGGGGGGG